MSGMFPVTSSHVYIIELRITTVSVCHICSAHLCLRDSLYTSGLVSVSPSQKIKLYIDDPTHIETQKLCLTNSRTSIGSPSVKTVHFYGHSSKANMNNCSNSRNRMPSSRHKWQTHAMTLPMWLQLQHPQWHKLSQQTHRPAYPSRPRITRSEVPRLLIPNCSMGIETRLKSS